MRLFLAAFCLVSLFSFSTSSKLIDFHDIDGKVLFSVDKATHERFVFYNFEGQTGEKKLISLKSEKIDSPTGNKTIEKWNFDGYTLSSYGLITFKPSVLLNGTWIRVYR